MTVNQEKYPRHDLAEFTPGLERKREFAVSEADLALFSDVSGDHHPLHGDPGLAHQRGYLDVLVHGMLIASRCSAFVAQDFVGSHGLLVSVASDFRQPVYCSEVLVWRGVVLRVTEEAGTIEIGWQVTNRRGLMVQRGTACTWLPSKS